MNYADGEREGVCVCVGSGLRIGSVEDLVNQCRQRKYKNS